MAYGDGSEPYQTFTHGCERRGGKRWSCGLAAKECPSRKAGPWRTALSVGGRRRYLSGRTRGEVISKLRAARGSRERGELTAKRAPTLGSWLTYWLAEIAPVRTGETTLAKRTNLVEKWLIPHLGHIRLDKLSVEDLRAFYRTYLEQHADTPTKGLAQMQTIRLVLNRAMKSAVTEGKVTRNVVELVEIPSAPQFVQSVHTDEEVRQILAHARTDVLTSTRFVIAIALGLRQGECLALTWEDVDLSAGTLTVRRSLARRKGLHGCGVKKGLKWPCGQLRSDLCTKPGRPPTAYLKEPKSQAGKRVIALPAPLLDIMKDYRRAQVAHRLAYGRWVGWQVDGQQVDLVFTTLHGRPQHASEDALNWHAFLDAAGVSQTRLHDARHFAATTLLELGVDPKVVAEILGHAHPGITTRIYQHVTKRMSEQAAQTMGDALWGEGGRKTS